MKNLKELKINKNLVIILCVLLLSMFLGKEIKYFFEEKFTPKYYQIGDLKIKADNLKIIKKYSGKYDVDYLLICALIQYESGFKSWMVSRTGATGMMQVLPSTGKNIAKELSIEADDKLEYLYDKDTNINIGTYYLSTLIEDYKGEKVAAIARYNYANMNWKFGWDVYNYYLNLSKQKIKKIR